MYSFSEQDFSDESLKYFSKTYFNHYFKDGDERVDGLRNASSNDEFSKGSLTISLLRDESIDEPKRTPMLLQEFGFFYQYERLSTPECYISKIDESGS